METSARLFIDGASVAHCSNDEFCRHLRGVGQTMKRLLLYSSPECTLCVPVKELLQQVAVEKSTDLSTKLNSALNGATVGPKLQEMEDYASENI